jgi:hypothetical protein
MSVTTNALNNSATEFQVDNLNLDGNTISSTNTDGNIVLSPDGAGLVSIDSAYTLPGADGTAGQVLTTDGAGSVSFDDPLGGWELITSGSSGSVNKVDFINLGTYRTIKLVIESLSTTTGSRFPVILFSNDNGATFLTTNYFSVANTYGTTISSTTLTNGNSTTAVLLQQGDLPTFTGTGMMGFIQFYNWNSTRACSFSGTTQTLVTGSAIRVNYLYGGRAGGFDALRVQLNTGITNFYMAYALYGLYR